MPARHSTSLVILGALAVAWTVLASGGGAEGLAALLPNFVLLAPLLLRRYPGETRIARMRDARRRAATGLVRAADARTPRALRRVAVRGRLLLARGLAVRPPPERPAHV